MAKEYYCYRKSQAPADVLEKWLNAAEYNNGRIIIVGEPSHADMVKDDLTQIEMQDDDGTDLDKIKKKDLVAKFKNLASKELRLSKAQGRYIYEKFKPEDTLDG